VMVLICNAFSSGLIALLWYSKIRRRIMLYCINSSRMTNAISHGLIWKKTCTQNRTDRSWWFVELAARLPVTISENNCMAQSGFDLAVPAFGRCNALFIIWNFVVYLILSFSYF
jgi:hypothetical protein